MVPLYAIDAILFAISAAFLRNLKWRSIAFLACIFAISLTVKDYRDGIDVQRRVQRIWQVAEQRQHAAATSGAHGNTEPSATSRR